MDSRILFLVFLCFFSASVICNVATFTVNATEGWSCKAFVHTVRGDYFTTNGTEPTGDPIDPPDTWPH